MRLMTVVSSDGSIRLANGDCFNGKSSISRFVSFIETSKTSIPDLPNVSISGTKYVLSGTRVLRCFPAHLCGACGALLLPVKAQNWLSYLKKVRKP